MYIESLLHTLELRRATRDFFYLTTWLTVYTTNQLIATNNAILKEYTKPKVKRHIMSKRERSVTYSCSKIQAHINQHVLELD